ncbi:class I SAM-dependent DNA methyltransferase [Hespellia stercorisuis]|uniref:Methyltransferase domain-containing protein n=1 Tax=Hespellia stercorisuis DSM 15480 TaxID=1121950 RepID=A0A1M6IHA2_9FIRM|nr:class I SAM-dependent methyltransferase [Hespellia stercorisuis]SHJ33837.1 Methyltransferase domain-containing protein [Hespellia stercorisuis DSM 15480]
MESYTSFAEVYDVFMDDVPYEEWAHYLCGLLEKYQVKAEGVIVDLGCGTGTMTEILSREGFDMIGVDNSGEMLAIAIQKKQESGRDILYLLQNMQELELYSTADAVVSVCDSVNYVTNETELLETFRRVNHFLEPGGVFIFDFNTEHKYRDVIGERTIAECREDCSFIWDNYYYEDEQINEYELNLFIQADREHDENLYRKFHEVHYQKGYTLSVIRELIESSGLAFVTAYDAFTEEAPTAESERIYVIARESGKDVM